MAERQTSTEAAAVRSSAGNLSSTHAGENADVCLSMVTEAQNGHPEGEEFRDDGTAQSARKSHLLYLAGSGKNKSATRSATELPTLACNTLEKEVYEYIPDATLGPVTQETHPSNSLLPALSSVASRPARAKGCDVDEQSLPPGAAFETFKDKTYEAARFKDGLLGKTGRGGSEGVTDVSAAVGDVSRKTPAYLFELGNTGFETPLGRLQRLRMEVEEMLNFVSTYRSREGTKIEGTVEQVTGGEVAGTNTAAAESVTGLRPAHAHGKEALFFGQEPQYLLSELGRLRFQILSVTNDPSLQQLFAGVEPTTGRQNGGEVLLKHLQEVQGNLEALQRTTGFREQELNVASGPERGDAVAAREESGAGALTRSSAGGSTCAQPARMAQYDIYCVPSFTPLLDCSRAAALESRLAQVERRVGMSKISLLPFPDLQQGIIHISQKLALLDANKVEQLHKRTQRLLHELHALQHRRRELDISGASAQLLETGKSSHRVAVDGAGYEGSHREAAAARAAAADDQRVEELFDICERWKVKAAALPSVVERLKALKALHREAGGISVRLQVLEEQQAQLQLVIDSAEQNLEGLQKTVAETVAWARTTVQTMQKRLQRLDLSSKGNSEGKKP